MSEIKDMDRKICSIHGSWLKRLVIGDKEYWNIDSAEAFKPIPVPNSLPSD
eukprot:CAMPEP_0202969758 /NCGR_PEP_ID=MMETSP1396-20130829/15623_1 /ASSEMBLY_ACC=CAM_ASM_000872 /TAXON_ID= /ORGANISM="Pseudokeronopsis sp., Strain Brazil" /LENGTH=50 /DNA_ID=CAMNT_0049697685 /DNA_START=1349 /DNA_END=1498 /DNA_ORIENTATION=+